MKSRRCIRICHAAILLLLTSTSQSQNVGIGTTNPNSARLQVELSNNTTVTTAILGKYTYTNNLGFGIGIEGDGYGYGYGIYGYNPSGGGYAGYFNGNLHYTGILSGPSDLRLKENEEPVGMMLDKVMLLKPSRYNFKKEYSRLNLPQGQQVGFIAQEIENVFPFLVTSNLYQDLDSTKLLSYKGVNYIGLIPLLTRALQELTVRNHELEITGKDLQKQLDNLSARVNKMVQVNNNLPGTLTPR